ncbi:hypothetical protein DPMN_051399 [Dreissena polymorpha]|uniref:Uncharacterized protein n=1 Tax=Dreissena polymorpha TaxID=45954 RepID=A0A9D4CHS7_DREPO|nr:hypothetical protein DPMN_051399 [Dreissena polymorpha]
MFYGAPYNVTVDELKPADTVNPILVLSVGDPDTGLGNQAFELVSVEAECAYCHNLMDPRSAKTGLKSCA